MSKIEFLNLGKQPITNNFLNNAKTKNEFFYNLKITFDEKLSKKMTALVNKHQDIKPFIGDTLFKDIFY